MKLQTMLLPTGEFVLVVSGAKLPHGNLWPDFSKHIGAAGCLFYDGDVEVEDACFDENARRCEPPAELGETFTKTVIPRATDGTREFSLEFTTTNQGDRILEDLLFGGAEFSPAGLVKNGGSAAELEPELQEALRDPWKPSLHHEPRAGAVTVEREVQLGDTVRVVEVAGDNREPYYWYVGEVGVVLDITSSKVCRVDLGSRGPIWARKVEHVDA